MPISLVPDEETPATVEPEKDETEEVLAYLANVHTPKLDALRAKVPTMKTSDLIGLACNPDALAHHLSVANMTDSMQQAIFMAGSVAIGTELDRRIPVPK